MKKKIFYTLIRSVQFSLVCVAAGGNQMLCIVRVVETMVVTVPTRNIRWQTAKLRASFMFALHFSEERCSSRR